MKISTATYVLKFVGGDNVTRKCTFCQRITTRGVAIIYPNCDCLSGDTKATVICRRCFATGCKDSEDDWLPIFKRAKEKRRLVTLRRSED